MAVTKRTGHVGNCRCDRSHQHSVLGVSDNGGGEERRVGEVGGGKERRGGEAVGSKRMVHKS